MNSFLVDLGRRFMAVMLVVFAITMAFRTGYEYRQYTHPATVPMNVSDLPTSCITVWGDGTKEISCQYDSKTNTWAYAPWIGGMK